MCIILSRVSFAKLKKIHCCHFFTFWLLPVGAAHGTPFYSQHARLSQKIFQNYVQRFKGVASGKQSFHEHCATKCFYIGHSMHEI